VFVSTLNISRGQLGYSRSARAFREAQRALISQGDFRGAQQMDVFDVQTKFGDKYDDAIQQMLDYGRALEE